MSKFAFSIVMIIYSVIVNILIWHYQDKIDKLEVALQQCKHSKDYCLKNKHIYQRMLGVEIQKATAQ